MRESPVPLDQNTQLLLDVTVAPHHKAYVDMFKVKFKSIPEVQVFQIVATPSFKFEDKFSKKTREGIKGSSTVIVDLRFPSTMKPGAWKGEAQFTYQVCTDTYCMFPTTMDIPMEFTTSLSTTGVNAPPSTDLLQNALNRGMLYAFFFVFLAGILTSFTPCIFPMIPITLAIIGARSAATSRHTKFRGFTLSLSYVLGIAVTYACLGMLAAKTGALFGSYLGHPLVVSAIALIFVIMGLSMYGLFEIKVPSFIANRLSSSKTEAGYFGAFVTGLIAGIVASPCVGPVLVSVLTYVAESKNLIFGFSLLFVFALGLGQIFLVLGTFEGLLKKIPKSGSWMNGVKFIFGTTMIVMAFYYLQPILPPSLRFFSSATLSENVQKLDWQHYSDELLAKARSEQRPVILDFWADWCVACKELEVFTLTDNAVREKSKDFVLLKLDATNSTDEVNRLKNLYRVVGLPTMIFFDSNGKEKKELTLTGFENADAFLKRMKSAAP
ncbi:MAG: cytochrome c biogenesis protein CcdA [Bdellovibrionales bacterium]